MRASGRWSKGLDVQVQNLKGIIYGEHYTQQLVSGRPPTTTTTASNPTLKEVIEQWIKDKGIQPLDASMKISSLAFLIARKIHREGTQYFKDGGTDLIDSVITPARIQQIIDKVTQFNVSYFVTDLKDTFIKMAA